MGTASNEHEVMEIALTNKIRLFNEDNMVGMKRTPDKHYDLAIVDPPYFNGPEKLGYYGEHVSSVGIKRSYEKIGTWNVPDELWLNELKRVSKHQIIWGINYFDFFHTSGRIIWDKCNYSSSFSDCEIASCSLHDSVRMFRFMWNGMLQGKSATEGHIMQGNKKLNEKRIHATQKPVILYKWLLSRYAKPGFKILDTHGGSLSIAIACHEMNMNLNVWEIDPDICSKSINRFRQETAQQSFTSLLY